MSVTAPSPRPDGPTGGAFCAHRHPTCDRVAEFELTLLDEPCGAWITVAVCAQHALRATEDPVFADWSDVCEAPDHLAHDVAVHRRTRITG